MKHSAAACAQVIPQPSSEAPRAAAWQDLRHSDCRKPRAEAGPALSHRAEAEAQLLALSYRRN